MIITNPSWTHNSIPTKHWRGKLIRPQKKERTPKDEFLFLVDKGINQNLKLEQNVLLGRALYLLF